MESFNFYQFINTCPRRMGYDQWTSRTRPLIKRERRSGKTYWARNEIIECSE